MAKMTQEEKAIKQQERDQKAALKQSQKFEIKQMKSAGASADDISREKAANRTELADAKATLAQGGLQDLSAEGFGRPVTGAATYDDTQGWGADVRGAINDIVSFADQYNLQPYRGDDESSTGFDYVALDKRRDKFASEGNYGKGSLGKTLTFLTSISDLSADGLTRDEITEAALGAGINPKRVGKLDDKGFIRIGDNSGAKLNNSTVQFGFDPETGLYNLGDVSRVRTDPQDSGGVFGGFGSVLSIASMLGKIFPGPWTPFTEMAGYAGTGMNAVDSAKTGNYGALALSLVPHIPGAGDFAKGVVENISGGIGDAWKSVGDSAALGMDQVGALNPAGNYDLGNLTPESVMGEGGFPSADGALEGFVPEGGFGGAVPNTDVSGLNLEGSGFEQILNTPENVAGQAGQMAQDAGIQEAINSTQYGPDYTPKTYSASPTFGTDASGKTIQLGNVTAENFPSLVTSSAVLNDPTLMKDLWKAASAAGIVNMGGKSLLDYFKDLNLGGGSTPTGGGFGLSVNKEPSDWLTLVDQDTSYDPVAAMNAAASATARAMA